MSLANISIEELFNLLDVNLDGALSRTELHHAAQRLGWHWNHAPLYAVLDLLTIPAPLSRSTFISYMNEIFRDPHGPYGHVLLHSMLFTDIEPGGSRTRTQGGPRLEQEEECVDLLQDSDETQAQISFDHAGLLIIDPQRSFTSGVWKQSISSNADVEVAPIRRAFDNCARMLARAYPKRVKSLVKRLFFNDISICQAHQRLLYTQNKKIS